MKTLTESIVKDFLENVTLYVWREFKKPDRITSIDVREVDSYCQKCSRIRPFQYIGSIPEGRGNFYPSHVTICLEFGCVSCQSERREYLVQKIERIETIKIQKYGELPKKKLERNRRLQQFFKDDMDNYEKAVICLSNGYGIGAFAYFRRIVENNINKLLDLVQQDVTSTGLDAEINDALSALREKSHMSEKIPIANRALPEHLKPDGLNPLQKLYQVLSKGVHGLTDEQCLKRANAISECLAYLVSELASRRKHIDEFKRTVGDL